MHILFKHRKKIACCAVFLTSIAVMIQPYYLAAEMSTPASLLKNSFSILLAEMLQLEPCFFNEEETEDQR